LTYGHENQQKVITCYLNAHKTEIHNKEATNKHAMFVFIHGGYWQFGNVEDSCYMATNFIKAGIDFASVGYELAPAHSIPDITEQTTKALLVLNKEFGDTHNFYLCGHSAGGYIAAKIILQGNESLTKNIEGYISVCGIYDLVPLVKKPL